MVPQKVGALGRHLALVGFMGAGKTTAGREVARLTARPFVDTDEEIERRHGPIADIFEHRGEAEFRQIEEAIVAEALARTEPAVIALGGGAVLSETTRALLRARAFTVWLRVDVETAWERTRGGGRPLARGKRGFRRLFEERQRLYGTVVDTVAGDVDGVLLATLGVVVERGVYSGLWADVPTAIVGDERVLALHTPRLPVRLHRVPSGERAKDAAVVERLWDELRLDRFGRLVAIGGGCTTDLAGFVASTYMRGIEWMAVPTTLVGQVDAAIGGKTAIDVGAAKNLVGTFHYPAHVLVDPDLLVTLPDEERRAGMAEVVKTGLLGGRDLWELGDEEMVRACAAFKCAVCLSDPFETEGRREILNLGHTFAHALEAASDYRLRHGEAVALGLLAALRLSGLPTDVVEQVLAPRPAAVDRERAWAAMRRDKKARDGRIRLVLLEAPGRPVFPVELPETDVRRALEELIAH